MSADWSLDVAISPADAIARIASAINQRPKRAFGVLKTENEFVGAIAGEAFEVWERRQRAVHAVGVARRKGRGTRVEVRFVLPPMTRALLVVFVALYVAVALGIASQPPDPGVTGGEVTIAIAGAAVVGGLFVGAARRQRADLAAFLEKVLRERERA